jgi:hypothetical protein
LIKGLIDVRKGGYCQIASTVSGINTGTAGSGLVAIKAEPGASVQFDTGPNAALDGKHGFMNAVDAQVVFLADVTRSVAALNGGPELYIEGGEIYFAGHWVKTGAPSGVPVLVAARNAKVTQATTKNFTLPAGSGNNVNDYGADGPIVAKDGLADLRLGNFTGCQAGTTGPGATLRNGARLVHAGVGLQGSGVSGPLVLGGLPAGPWPAAALTDAGAVVPEGCICIPGVT